MIQNDWTIARLVIQIIAEQGPGLAYAHAESQEDAITAATLKALGG